MGRVCLARSWSKGKSMEAASLKQWKPQERRRKILEDLVEAEPVVCFPYTDLCICHSFWWESFPITCPLCATLASYDLQCLFPKSSLEMEPPSVS